jgi:hypothetical protein
MLTDIFQKQDESMQDKKSVADLIIWRLASIRISPESEKPELYCLILEGEKDCPLTRVSPFFLLRMA